MKTILCRVVDENGKKTEYQSVDNTDDIIRHAKSILFDNDLCRDNNWGVECQTKSGKWLSLPQYMIEKLTE